METLIDEDFDEVEHQQVFAVGDRVQIFQTVPSYSDGWDNEWYVPGMSPMVGDGKIYTIRSIKNLGIYFEETANRANDYGWPAKALMLARNDLLTKKPSSVITRTGSWSPYVTTTTTSSRYIIG